MHRMLTLLFAAAVLVIPSAVAEDHDEDAWSYELDVTDGKAEVQMERERGEDEGEISFEYDRDEAKVSYGYEREANGTEVEAEMEVQFHQLVEYEDENGNDRYDPGEEILGGYTLALESEERLTGDAEKADWGAITRTSHTSEDGVPGHKFSSTARLDEGTLTFDFYVHGDEATLGAAEIEATELKLDIRIQDYPYQSDTSSLALLVEVGSEAEIEEDDDVERDEDGVRAQAADAQLSFAWKDFATVDGSDEDVGTTSLEVETERSAGEYEHEELFVFSYPRGDDVVHDPTMGVATQAGAAATPAPAMALAVLALFAGALVARRD
ncbi:MAG: hypothetical protein R3185_01395 [Candidatus Thermoplasmatota archaeon]|nr:hypothetical protein [Candidatus Thermoplasmatota archaeon]